MKLINVFILLGILVSLSGCLSDSQADASVSFEVLLTDSGPKNGVLGNRKFEFINNQVSYDEAVARYSGEVTTQLDFTNSQVVLLDIGQRGTGGYSVRVDRIVESNGSIGIIATEISPGAGCFTTSASTSPYVFIKVLSTNRVRTVTINGEIIDCGAP